MLHLIAMCTKLKEQNSSKIKPYRDSFVTMK